MWLNTACVLLLTVVFAGQICLAEDQAIEGRRARAEEIESTRRASLGLAPEVGTNKNPVYLVSSLDGKAVYATYYGCDKIDIASKTVVKNIPTSKSLWGITMAVKSGYLYATHDYDPDVTVIDSKTDEVVKVIKVP